MALWPHAQGWKPHETLWEMISLGLNPGLNPCLKEKGGAKSGQA